LYYSNCLTQRNAAKFAAAVKAAITAGNYLSLSIFNSDEEMLLEC
jgi:N-acetylglucosamine kinase-like BadF-type ATPase